MGTPARRRHPRRHLRPGLHAVPSARRSAAVRQPALRHGAQEDAWPLRGPARACRAVLPEVSVGLAAIVERMLAKNPADRFATPAEVAAALAPFAAGADLTRLPEPTDAAEAPVSASSLPQVTADTARSVQALMDTRQSGKLRPPVVTRRYARPAALIGCFGLFLVAA